MWRDFLAIVDKGRVSSAVRLASRERYFKNNVPLPHARPPTCRDPIILLYKSYCQSEFPSQILVRKKPRVKNWSMKKKSLLHVVVEKADVDTTHHCYLIDTYPDLVILSYRRSMFWNTYCRTRSGFWYRLWLHIYFYYPSLPTSNVDQVAVTVRVSNRRQCRRQSFSSNFVYITRLWSPPLHETPSHHPFDRSWYSDRPHKSLFHSSEGIVV